MKKRRCVNGLLLATAFLLAGCAPLILFGAGTAAGVAGYEYYNGTLNVLFEAPFMEVWDASLKTVEELGMGLRSADHKLTSGRITARQGENEFVGLSLEYRSARETAVALRMGLFGNEKRSMVVKDKIAEILARD